MSRIGVISSIWRYPVKGMLGEELVTAAVGADGIEGDRRFAVLETDTGHVASIKHPRKWLKLLSLRSYFVEPGIVGIEFPDGSRLVSDEPEKDEVLSDYLGRKVRLIDEAAGSATREANRSDDVALEEIRTERLGQAAEEGSFFDFAPLHVLTLSSLASLARLNPGSSFGLPRFRPNLVIDQARPGFPELAWLGRTIKAGAVNLDLIEPTPRCIATTLPQREFPKDPEVLRTIAQNVSAKSVSLMPGHEFNAVLGVYARAQGHGTLDAGQDVWLTEVSGL